MRGKRDVEYCGIDLMIMRVERGCSIGSIRDEGEKGCGILWHLFNENGGRKGVQ